MVFDYYAPKSGKDRKVTKELDDGYYSFDLHDSYGDGLQSDDGHEDYFPGSFKVTETDTGRVLHEGAAFKSYISMEFEITNGVPSVVTILDW